VKIAIFMLSGTIPEVVELDPCRNHPALVIDLCGMPRRQASQGGATKTTAALPATEQNRRAQDRYQK
jgi:hypothetical protein